ncbi:MAG: glycosyltransferase family 4 protein [Flavobacteriales bacterium]|nr:glycosyltransferase family 4 protein [Flavobacteriales bacterium]
MAKIAVNTRLLLKDKLEGIGWFAYESLKRITQNNPQHDFYFIFDRKHDNSFVFGNNVYPIEIGPPSRHPILWYIWFEYAVPKVLKRIDADLFFSPDGYLSLKTKIKSIPVIHDINFLHHPKDLRFSHQKYYNHYFPKYAKAADKIVTVSEFSKDDIHKHFGIQKNKIEVVYNGYNTNFQPLTHQKKSEIRTKYTEGMPYFIFVGSLHPRKNVVRLFKAFDLYRAKNDHTNTKLLIVGQKMWWTDDIKHAYQNMKYKDEVIFTGRLSSEELYKVVPSAEALLYISYFEGFGIPILEAMASGTPVITSNITAMPEIAGDAAILIDPYSTDAIAQGMLEITNNRKASSQLIQNGIDRAKLFSWDKTADQLSDIIEKSLITQ